MLGGLTVRRANLARRSRWGQTSRSVRRGDPPPYGVEPGGRRRLVACSNAYAISRSLGSLHASPVKLTPNGCGAASKLSGNGGTWALDTTPNGTITVG